MNLRIPAIALPFFFLGQMAVAQTNPATNYVMQSQKYRQFPDSIRIEFPDNKAVMIFQFRKVTGNTKAFDDFQKRLQRWVVQLAAAFPGASTPQHVTIRVDEKGETEMQAEGGQKITRIKSSAEAVTELLPPGWELNVSLSDMSVYVYAQTFAGLESLSRQSLTTVTEKIDAEINGHPLHRKGLIARYVLGSDKITYSDVRRRIAGDFLEISGGGGFGFMGDKFYPELDVIVDLRFANRYMHNRQKVSFLYQNLFFAERKADGGYSNHTNAFVSTAWGINLNTGKGPQQWLSFGAGYLVGQTGNYFPGHTAKFFVSQTIGHITITPEIYLTNDFKNFQTGIRLGFVF